MRAYFFFLPQYQQAMSGFGFLISEEGSVLFYNSLRFLMVLVNTPNYLEMTTLDEGGLEGESCWARKERSVNYQDTIIELMK